RMPVASARLIVYLLVAVGGFVLISRWVNEWRERQPPPIPKPKPPSEGQKKWQAFRLEVESLSIEQARGRVDAIMRTGAIWEPGEAAAKELIDLSQMPSSAEA